MTTRTAPASDHVVLRHRLDNDGAGAVLLAGGFFLAVTIITAVAAWFADGASISGWEAGTQLIRWFVGAIGVYLTSVYLPLYVAHGFTRREVAVDGGLFALAYAAIVAVLITIGFALERVVYGLAGWQQTLERTHLFDAPDQYGLILAEHLVLLAVWVAAGALLGVAFYRGGGVPLVALPVAILAVTTIEAVTGPAAFGPVPPPVFERLTFLPTEAGPAVAAATAVVATAVLAAGTWWLVRDVPIRSQNT